MNTDLAWDSPSLDDSEAMEVIVGTVVETFWEDHDMQAWSLMLDVNRMESRWEQFWPTPESWPVSEFVVSMMVNPASLGRFTGEASDRIESRIVEVARQCGSPPIDRVEYRRTLPAVDPSGWRQKQAERASVEAPVSNNAVKDFGRDLVIEDGLRFRSQEEKRIYAMLKGFQDKAVGRAGWEMSIFPLANGRLAGSLREPDFLVIIDKKVGIIEVDGPHHNQLWASDKSRDRLFNAGGVWLVEHIYVEELQDEEALEQRLSRWLKEVKAQN